MTNLRRFSLLIALVTVGTLMPACSQPGGNSPGTNTPAASPAASQAAGTPYYGAVDRRDCETVAGWVMNTAAPEADIKVELYIDGKLGETLPAKTLRPDLANKVGTGQYGFAFKIPSASKDNRPHSVSVKVAGGNYTVPFVVPSTFECKP